MWHRRRNAQAVSFFAFQDIIMCVTGIMTLCSLLLALSLLRTPRDADQYHKLRRAVAEHRAEVLRLRQRLEAATATTDLDSSERNEALLRELEAKNAALRQRRDELLRSVERSARVAQAEQARLSAERAKLEGQIQHLTQQKQALEKRIERWQSKKRLRFRVQRGFNKRAWVIQIEPRTLLVARIDRHQRTVRRFTDLPHLTAWVSAGCEPDSDYFLLLVGQDAVRTFRELRRWLLSKGYDIGYDLLLPGETAVDPDWDLAGGP